LCGLIKEIDPRNIQNLTWWGYLFLEKYNNADAQRTLEEALSINQHSADLYVGYANSLESLTQKESLANKALEENSNCVDALNILAQVQILDARYDVAKEILVGALEINPSYEQSLANLATVYHLRNERESYNQTELKILLSILKESRTISQLADALSKDLSWISRNVNHLQELGFVMVKRKGYMIYIVEFYETE